MKTKTTGDGFVTNNPDQTTKQVRGRLIPLARFNDYHATPSVKMLRWLRFKNTFNFNRCIFQCGRLLMIDEAALFEWIAAYDAECRKQRGLPW